MFIMIAAISSLFWGAEEDSASNVNETCIPHDFPCDKNEWIFVRTTVEVEDKKDLDDDFTDDALESEEEMDLKEIHRQNTTTVEAVTNCHQTVPRITRKLQLQHKEWIHQNKKMKPSESKMLQRCNQVNVRHHGARSSKRLGRMTGKHTAVVGKRAS